ncbi:MAG: ATPase [Chloroflexi bacterium]|nr:ATPase [Chloroflexota bacterium]
MGLETIGVGGWWSRQEEIDLVAMNGPEIVLAGECNWTSDWLKIGDLNELRRKAALAGAGPATRYALFSRSGFDPNLVALARAEGVLLYGLEELMTGSGESTAPTAAGAPAEPAPGG